MEGLWLFHLIEADSGLSLECLLVNLPG